MRLKRPRLSRAKLDTTNLAGEMFSAVALWQLVFLIGATVLVSMWNLDVVREFVFEHLEYGRAGRASAALNDSSDTVAASACIHLLNERNASAYSDVAETLYRRPQVAFQCLETANAGSSPAEGPEAARPEGADDAAWPEVGLSASSGVEELVPSFVLVASTLSQYWMGDLIDGSDNTCQTAYNTRRALELAGVDPTYRLMTCAVGADSPEVRECCVTQLGGHEAFLEMLNRPNLVPLYLASFDYRALVGAAFPSVPLASELLGQHYQKWMVDVPATPPSTGQASGGERFGELQYDVQDWVVNVGCRIHYNLVSRQQMAAAFVPLVESAQCAPTSPPWQGMYSPESWTDMCLGMYAYRRQMAFSPREAICDSLATSTAGRSIVNAQFVVASAVNNSVQVPGVNRKKIKLVGENFGTRLFGFRTSLPLKKENEAEKLWTTDGVGSPMNPW